MPIGALPGAMSADFVLAILIVNAVVLTMLIVLIRLEAIGRCMDRLGKIMAAWLHRTNT